MSNFFKLEKNTLDELHSKYLQKIESIRNSNLSEEDKTNFISHMTDMYRQQKKDLASNYIVPFERWTPFDFDRMDNTFNRIQNSIDNMMRSLHQPIPSHNMYSYSRNYNETRLSDGSSVVLETSRVNNNGQISENSNSYRKFRDGRTEPVHFDDSYKQNTLKY
jgi:hypothetical protein